MPTYDYECNGCGHAMELFQQITENPKKKCPSCGKMRLRRLIGAGAAIIFKGSGFYETDYKRKPKPPEVPKMQKPPELPKKKDSTNAGSRPSNAANG